MKRLFALIAILAFTLPALESNAQALSEKAKRKFSVGVDVFTDLWQYQTGTPYLPQSFETRTINQGATAFFMYNLQLGESMSSFSIGLAIRNHNMYSRNSIIPDIKRDSIIYELIQDQFEGEKKADWKRSKINLVYLDIPVEFKYRSEKGFKLVVGFKVGYLIDSKQKYIGNRPEDYRNVHVKTKNLNRTQDWTYGPTLRVGFKWVSIYGYYQLSDVFDRGFGPELYPISIGLTISPF